MNETKFIALINVLTSSDMGIDAYKIYERVREAEIEGKEKVEISHNDFSRLMDFNSNPYTRHLDYENFVYYTYYENYENRKNLRILITCEDNLHEEMSEFIIKFLPHPWSLSVETTSSRGDAEYYYHHRVFFAYNLYDVEENERIEKKFTELAEKMTKYNIQHSSPLFALQRMQEKTTAKEKNNRAIRIIEKK